ncbi:DUF5711 family protein [Faecalibacterium prausnitzii]|uniref:DUF5711 family protein n=1 Tax=Faecalibacterium prausnitzii TaxID=853 RepID=UPI003C2C804A
MRKISRGRSENDEPLSAGRVEYLEQARQRVRTRRIRRTAVLLVLLTAVVLFATGVVGSSVTMAKDFIDTARIALLPGSGWPQQTGVSEVTQVEPLTGSFVELGKEGCVVYSRSGKKLNSIQSGYARPAIAAGKTRFVLYNRSGNELQVESRTQNLYTKQMENSIFLCAVADNGNLAVVTEDISAMAKLLVYNANMEEVLRWSMSSNDGTPLRMAFSPDSRKLAAAAVTASGGQMMTNLYLINLASGDPVSIANQSGVPQWLGWTSASTLLAVYDTRVVLYNAGGGERAAYEFAGNTLKDVSVDADGQYRPAAGVRPAASDRAAGQKPERPVQRLSGIGQRHRPGGQPVLSAVRQRGGVLQCLRRAAVEPDPCGQAPGTSGRRQRAAAVQRQYGAGAGAAAGVRALERGENAI